MSTKHNTKHPERGRSTYSKKRKGRRADQYGTYDNGVQKSADKIVSWETPNE